MSVAPRLALAGIAVSAALALVACGGTVVDDQKLEDQIKDTAPRGTVVESVDCPSNVDVDVGHTISCTVQVKGGPRRELTYRILDEDAHLNLISNKPAK